jgi:hypothetical protein
MPASSFAIRSLSVAISFTPQAPRNDVETSTGTRRRSNWVAWLRSFLNNQCNLGEDIMFDAPKNAKHIPAGRFMWKWGTCSLKSALHGLRAFSFQQQPVRNFVPSELISWSIAR